MNELQKVAYLQGYVTEEEMSKEAIGPIIAGALRLGGTALSRLAPLLSKVGPAATRAARAGTIVETGRKMGQKAKMIKAMRAIKAKRAASASAKTGIGLAAKGAGGGIAAWLGLSALGRGGSAVSGGTKKALDILVPLALVTPGLLGVAAAFIHSRLTSPGKIEGQTAQAELEAAELEQALAEMRRRRQHRLTRGN